MLIKRYFSKKSIINQSINSSRKYLTKGTVLLFLLLFPKLSYSVDVLDVRVWPADDYTRVTIETDQILKFKQKIFTAPDRIVIDLYNVKLDSTVKQLVAKITPNDPQITEVRVGQFQTNIVRLVFNLKSPLRVQTFTLKPLDFYRHRLVVDLYPMETPDPLLALLEKSKNKETKLKPLLPTTVTPIKSINQQSSATNSPSNSEEAERFFEYFSQRFQPSDEEKEDPIDIIASTSSREFLIKKSNYSSLPHSTTKFRLPKSDGAKTNFCRLLTIAIDPGHGGEDPGAIGPSGTYEKNVVLDIAKRLREKIDKQPDMQAIITRDSDFFVPLHIRVQKARRVGADLFISIHADAFTSPKAQGSSVFALSEHGASSTTAHWLANKENSSDQIGGVSLKKQDLALSRLLLDMSTSAQIRDSLRYGDFILNEISQINKLHKLTVEQAGFAVLRAPDIPSILVETAFISNPEEEKKLNSELYREKMAEAILMGVKKFFAAHRPIYCYPDTTF